MNPFKKSVLTLGIAAALVSSVGCVASTDYQQLASNEVFASNEAGVSDVYQKGQRAMDNGDWKKAIKYFDEMVKDGNNHVDAALYWRAYCEFRAGRKSKASRSLKILFKNHKSSQWINEAKSLQAEIKGVDQISDDELKEYALNSLLHASPERAMPILKKTLASNNSKDVKEMALFVLSQLGTEEALQLIETMAKNNAAPELQKNAIQMLALSGDKKSLSTLGNLYNTITDVSVREEILTSFMISGDKTQLLKLAKTEKNLELRASAIELLGTMGAEKELLPLYQNETSLEVKESILSAMMISANIEGLNFIISNEKNPNLLSEAIQMLGIIGGKNSKDVLNKLWSTRTEPSVRESIMEVWMITHDSDSLIKVASTSKNHREKIEAIEYLGVLHNKSALRDLYKSESDPKVKEQLIESLMMTGDIELLSDIIENETDEKIITNAINVAAAFGKKEILDKLIITYQKTKSDVVKSAIIESWMISNDVKSLLKAAKSETDPELIEKAIEGLAVLGKSSLLSELYSNKLTLRSRKAIIEGYMISRDSKSLVDLLDTETDAELKEEIIEMLGVMNDDIATKALTKLYKESTDIELKSTIIDSYMVQGKAKVLIEIFRTEKNQQLRRQAVRNLSMMNSKEAQELMLELVEKG